MRVVEQIYNSAVLVTPSDTADIPLSKGIMIGGTGTLAVITQANQTLTLTGLAVGVIHPIAVRRVLSAGTSATNIAAFS